MNTFFPVGNLKSDENQIFHTKRVTKKVGQFVEVNPNVNVQAPIKIELGSLPLSLGLFAGSGLLFIAKGEVPQGVPKTVATLLALGLAGAGVLNLFAGRFSSAEAATVPSSSPSSIPPGGGAESQPIPYTVSEEVAFDNVVGRIVSPQDFTTVDIGFFDKSYPARIEIQNNSEVPVTLDIELTSEENPQPVGAYQVTSLPLQVSLAAKQVKNIDVNIPLVAFNSVLVIYADVDLTMRKRRGVQGDAQLLDMKNFVVR